MATSLKRRARNGPSPTRARPQPLTPEEELVRLALHNYAVRPTRVRRAVLAVLLRAPIALSGAEIELQLRPLSDRITLYRTLCTFEQAGLIHRVVDHADTVRYAACPNPTSREAATSHVHFKCLACRHIYCLSQVPVPAVELPGPYQVTRGDYLLSGICARCQGD